MYNVEHHTTATTINLLSFAFWRCSSCISRTSFFLLLSVGFVIAVTDRYTNTRPLIIQTQTRRYTHIWNFTFFSLCTIGMHTFDPHIVRQQATDQYRIVYGMMRSVYAINKLIFNFRLQIKWILVYSYFFLHWSLRLSVSYLRSFAILPQSKWYRAQHRQTIQKAINFKMKFVT